ncbi:MAG: DUF6157 family protein [Caldilineaceae bacterium]
MHSTNYFNTLIEIAEDSRATGGEAPPLKGDKKTVANLQFELIHDHPYEFTSDELIFSVFAIRKEIPEAEWAAQRELFFSKGQPCLRASPLTKSYGWGIHSNAEGKIAMFGVGSDEYQRLLDDDTVVKTKAMRSKRA